MQSTGDAPGILLLGNHAPPFGGVPNHIGHLARHLGDRGWRVHVMSDMSLRRGSYQVGPYWVHAPTAREKVRNLLRSPPPRAARRSVRRARREPASVLADVARANLARRLVREHDLRLLSTYHVLKPGISAAWVSEDLGLPLVTTLFGEIFDNPELHRSRLDDVRYILDRSSSVLSCSRHCASSVSTVLALPHQVDVMYYGVEVDRAAGQAAGPDVLAAIGGRPSGPTVLYVGRMVAEMGLGVLLDAVPEMLRRHPDARVLVAGSSGPLTAAARAVADSSDGRVSVHPDVDGELLPSLYSLADVVVAPSTSSRACLGLAIADAMAAGKPVVACRVGGTAEVVVDGETGCLVAPNDPGAIADAVSSYLADDERRRVHGAAGRRRAAAVFDVRATNDRCEQLFLDVLTA